MLLNVDTATFTQLLSFYSYKVQISFIKDEWRKAIQQDFDSQSW